MRNGSFETDGFLNTNLSFNVQSMIKTSYLIHKKCE